MNERQPSPNEESTVQQDEYTPSNVVVEPDALAKAIRNQVYETLGFDGSKWAGVVPDERAGWCYQCAEAYYHGVEDGVRARLTPMQVTIDVVHPNFVGEVSHWFLHHDDGAIIDLTPEQFHIMCVEIPYAEASGRGFVPPSPSSQSETLLDALPDDVVDNRNY